MIFDIFEFATFLLLPILESNLDPYLQFLPLPETLEICPYRSVGARGACGAGEVGGKTNIKDRTQKNHGKQLRSSWGTGQSKIDRLFFKYYMSELCK